MLDLLILVPSLRRGGAERFTVNLFNSLSKNESVELVTISKEGGFYDFINNKSLVTSLGFKRVATSVLVVLKLIRLKKPAVILTMFVHLSALVLVLKMLGLIKSRVVVREVNLPSRLLKKKKWPFIFKLIYRYLYPYADVIICQSEDMYDDIKNYTSANLVIINNPVDSKAVLQRSNEKDVCGRYGFNDGTKKNVIFIGRLTYQKGIDILMDFASMLDESTVLHILGTGDLKNWVINKIKEKNLENRVCLHGEVENPYALLKRSDYLMVSSRYEGFPNVVLESLVLGVPVVAVPFKGGSKEIFVEKENCVLADCFSGKCLFDSFKSAEKITFNSTKISECAVNKFDVSIISNKYKEILF